jgi:hypothetical protein
MRGTRKTVVQITNLVGTEGTFGRLAGDIGQGWGANLEGVVDTPCVRIVGEMVIHEGTILCHVPVNAIASKVIDRVIHALKPSNSSETISNHTLKEHVVRRAVGFTTKLYSMVVPSFCLL